MIIRCFSSQICLCIHFNGYDIGTSPSGWKEKPWCISQVARRTYCWWSSYCQNTVARLLLEGSKIFSWSQWQLAKNMEGVIFYAFYFVGQRVASISGCCIKYIWFYSKRFIWGCLWKSWKAGNQNSAANEFVIHVYRSWNLEWYHYALCK